MFYFFVVDDQPNMNQMICNLIRDICKRKNIEIMIYSFYYYSKDFYRMAYSKIPNKVFVCDIEIISDTKNYEMLESGIEFGKKLRQRDTISDLIYLSNYDYENEVATSIFNCTRYIKKNSKDMEQQLDETIDYLLFKKGEQQKIVFRITKQMTYQFSLNEINYVQKIKESKYCRICTTSTDFKYYITLKELNKAFFHNHFKIVKRSYLVNPYNIQKETKNEIIFYDGTELPS